MPELVGVHGRAPSGPGPIVNDLIDTDGVIDPLRPTPKLRQVGEPMPFPRTRR
jgi:hypothetical protein